MKQTCRPSSAVCNAPGILTAAQNVSSYQFLQFSEALRLRRSKFVIMLDSSASMQSLQGIHQALSFHARWPSTADRNYWHLLEVKLITAVCITAWKMRSGQRIASIRPFEPNAPPVCMVGDQDNHQHGRCQISLCTGLWYGMLCSPRIRSIMLARKVPLSSSDMPWKMLALGSSTATRKLADT